MRVLKRVIYLGAIFGFGIAALGFSVAEARTLRICWPELNSPADEYPASFILSMGANGTGRLKKANDDAENFAKEMASRLGIHPSGTCVLTDIHNGEFRKNLKRLKKLTKKNDSVFIYFSGHGTYLQEGKYHKDEPDCLDEALVPHYEKDVSTESIRDDSLVRWVNALPVQENNVFVFLDTCFASSFRRGKRCSRVKEKFLKNGKMPFRSSAFRGKECPERKHLHELKGTLYAASREGQSAWEIEGKGGRFTYTFLDKLKNYKKDKKLDVSDLNPVFRQTVDEILRTTKNTSCFQEPQKWPR
ncbi:MAG: caspase family protein [Gammaproteobacteria bacterium]|nr:caspase family protein [Gammaproteobacteria bacterium]